MICETSLHFIYLTSTNASGSVPRVFKIWVPRFLWGGYSNCPYFTDGEIEDQDVKSMQRGWAGPGLSPVNLASKSEILLKKKKSYILSIIILLFLIIIWRDRVDISITIVILHRYLCPLRWHFWGTEYEINGSFKGLGDLRQYHGIKKRKKW